MAKHLWKVLLGGLVTFALLRGVGIGMIFKYLFLGLILFGFYKFFRIFRSFHELRESMEKNMPGAMGAGASGPTIEICGKCGNEKSSNHVC